MKQLKISQCKRDLDFHSLKPEPQVLPAYTYESYLVCGFQKSSDQEAIQLEGDFVEIWTTLYPRLSAPELARFINSFKGSSLFTEEILLKLLQKYYVKNNEENLETLSLILKLPLNLQNYISEKELSFSELNLLRYFRTEELWQSLLEALTKFQSLNLSKSQLSQALELYCELLLLNSKNNLLSAKSGEELIKNLLKARYPQALSRDESRQIKLKSFAWPLRTNARWVRHGDQAGLELKLTSFSPQELERQIETLSHIKSEVQSGLWNLN